MVLRRVLPVLALVGCTDGSPPNATLADLPRLSVSMQIWQSSDAGPTTGFMTLGYDSEAFRASHGGECAVIGDYAVEFAGLEIGRKSRGGDDTDFDDCYAASFELSIPQFGDTPLTSYRISDGSLTIEATFAPDTLVPHEPRLVSPTTWELAGGDAAVMIWSHPEDLIEGASFLPHPVYFHTRRLEDPNYFDIDAQLVGDEIRFAIPDPPPIVGDGFIVARFGYVVGDAATCSGATRCAYSLERGYSHSVKITK